MNKTELEAQAYRLILQINLLQQQLRQLQAQIAKPELPVPPQPKKPKK